MNCLGLAFTEQSNLREPQTEVESHSGREEYQWCMCSLVDSQEGNPKDTQDSLLDFFSGNEQTRVACNPVLEIRWGGCVEAET
jgi:hypothetical protein